MLASGAIVSALKMPRSDPAELERIFASKATEAIPVPSDTAGRLSLR
jgi:hypothetical protein